MGLELINKPSHCTNKRLSLRLDKDKQEPLQWRRNAKRLAFDNNPRSVCILSVLCFLPSESAARLKDSNCLSLTTHGNAPQTKKNVIMSNANCMQRCSREATLFPNSFEGRTMLSHVASPYWGLCRFFGKTPQYN